MEFIINLAMTSVEQVLLSLQHNWLYLLVSVIIAVVLKLYINAEKVSTFLNRNRGAGVVAATTAAVATPLCSCGTTAVVLGMMASTMPWAPIVAFMVASPLTSPEGLVYSAGIFGWPFAIAFYLASIFLGLVGGWVAAILESRGWLANQTRFAKAPAASCACSEPASPYSIGDPGLRVISIMQPETGYGLAGEAALSLPASGCGCSSAAVVQPGPILPAAIRPKNQPASTNTRITPVIFLKEFYTGGKNLLVMFVGFAFVGYFLNGLIPAGWISALFGNGSIYNVPLAATLGLPFYINSEASLPLVRAMLDNGMSQGAALAFLISGAGTSLGAITGALTIARWRVVALVVGILWAGAIISGVAFNWVLMLQVF